MSMVAKKAPYTLFIVDDSDVESPRENDNLGTMACWHSRYSLGDKHDFDEPRDLMFSLIEEKLGDTDMAEEKFDELISAIDRSDYRHGGSYNKAVDDNILDYLSSDYVILPLYLYDHSGITMNTTGFSCPWDSGQVGLYYVSFDKIKEEYGSLTPENIQKATEVLQAEVEEYDLYISGQCYGFKLFEGKNEINACWGFLASMSDIGKRVEEYLPDECKDMVNSLEYQSGSLDEDEYLSDENEDEEDLER